MLTRGTRGLAAVLFFTGCYGGTLWLGLNWLACVFRQRVRGILGKGVSVQGKGVWPRMRIDSGVRFPIAWNYGFGRSGFARRKSRWHKRALDMWVVAFGRPNGSQGGIQAGVIREVEALLVVHAGSLLTWRRVAGWNVEGVRLHIQFQGTVSSQVGLE